MGRQSPQGFDTQAFPVAAGSLTRTTDARIPAPPPHTQPYPVLCPCPQYLLRPLRYADSHVLQTALMVSLCLLSIVSIPSATWQQLAVDPTFAGPGVVKFLSDAAAVCICGGCRTLFGRLRGCVRGRVVCV